MANICSNSMTITGELSQVNDLRDKIVKQDEGLIKLFTWFETETKPGNAYGLINDLEELAEDEGAAISLEYTTKWSPPTDELIALSAAYPELTIENQYEESGMAAYGQHSFKNGECISDRPMTTEEYLLEDDDFGALIENIKTCTYKKFLKEYLPDMENLEDNDPSFKAPWLVEKYILKRLKNKDLPLLINHVWHNEINQKEFETRLKGE